MSKTERHLIELQSLATKGGGLEIKFSGHNPTVIDEIPHPWVCIVGSHNERYAGYGTTMNNAIDNAYKNWQEA